MHLPHGRALRTMLPFARCQFDLVEAEPLTATFTVVPFSSRRSPFESESTEPPLVEASADCEICSPRRVPPTDRVVEPTVCTAVLATPPTVSVVELTTPPTVFPTPPSNPPPPPDDR